MDTPLSPPPAPTVPEPGRTSLSVEISPVKRGIYGVAEYRSSFGARFVACDLSEAQAKTLAEVARAVGCRPGSTSQFLTESNPQ